MKLNYLQFVLAILSLILMSCNNHVINWDLQNSLRTYATSHEGVPARESFGNFHNCNQVFKFTKLKPYRTYIFWLSTIQHGVGANAPFAQIRKADSLAYRMLEISLEDENGNTIDYNDDYTSFWSGGEDTLALIRFRTSKPVQYQTVFLTVSAHGDEIPPILYQVHLTSYETPSWMADASTRTHFEIGAIAMSEIQPILLMDNCRFETTVVSKAVTDSFQLRTGKYVYRTGAKYESGAGFGVRKERCATNHVLVDDRLEPMLHNFRVLWFRPPTTGVYSFTLEKLAESSPMLSLRDSLGLAIFADLDFNISDSANTDPAQLNAAVAAQIMRISDDIGKSPKMIGSGKYFPDRSTKIIAGPISNDAQGLLLRKDSLYYVFVSAPMFKTFDAKLTVQRSGDSCSNAVEISGVNHYNFNSNGVVSYCIPEATSGPDTAQNLVQNNFPHLKMEPQWTDFCWYKLLAPNPATTAYDFTVQSEFEGKIAFYTYGDIDDFTTYTLVQEQLIGFPTQPTIVQFSIPNVPKQEMLMLIGHNEGQSGTININMAPIFPKYHW